MSHKESLEQLLRQPVRDFGQKIQSWWTKAFRQRNSMQRHLWTAVKRYQAKFRQNYEKNSSQSADLWRRRP